VELAPRAASSGRWLIVSTTSVSPSQRPMDSPIHSRIDGGAREPPNLTMRTSWFISTRIAT
jgi:hypothetical protein